MPTLRICIPSKVHVNAKFMMSMLNCIPKIRAETGYEPDLKFLCGKSNIDQARSMLCTDFYDQCTDEDLMLFIDSDHIFELSDIKTAIAIGGDVSCGIYPNSVGQPTCYMMDPPAFIKGTNNEIRYAGTGFMMIKRPTLVKLHDHLIKQGLPARARISGPQYNNVIPFFKQNIIPSELNPGNNDWLGEDYTFCYNVRQTGGTIRGFFTKSLGHEVANIRIFYPENAEVAKVGPLVKYHLPLVDGKLVPIESERETDIVASEPIYEVNLNIPDENQRSATTIMKNNKEIVYFCGLSRVEFSPKMNNLGGSEQAVVQLSREWVKAGYSVTVYGNVTEGVFDGVQYYHVTKFDLNREYNCLILWRGFGLQILPIVKAKHLYIDLHDATDPKVFPREYLDRVEKIFVKSQWHKTNWDHVPVEKYVTILNGMNVELYNRILATKPDRNKFDICYTSCYTRGLYEILTKCWPIIKQNIPEATFHVCYGDDLILDQEFKEKLHKALNQDGIIHYGRISAEEVGIMKATCSLHLYLCTVPQAEIDCISVRESYYANCIPLTFKEGVFIERRGIMIPAKHTDQNAYQVATMSVLNLLKNEALLSKVRAQPKSEITWNQVATEWLKHLPYSDN